MRGGLLHIPVRIARGLALATVVLVACTASTPQPSPSSTEQAQGSPAPTATPIPPIKPARSVGQVGSGFAASGDFRGNGKSQIALIEPGAGDASLQILLREPDA